MDSILSLRPFTPHRSLPSSIFTPNRRIKFHTTRRLQNPQIRRIPKALVSSEASGSSKQEETPLPRVVVVRGGGGEASGSSKQEERPVIAVAKQVLLALVCFGIGFSPFRSAIAAAPVAVTAQAAVEEKKEVGYASEGYGEVTKRLLETTAVLVRSVEAARNGKGDVKAVEEAWAAVRAKKEELQGEIMSKMEAELRRLRRSKEGLVWRSDEIVEEVVKVRRDIEKALRDNAGKAEGKEKVGRMEERVERLEEEYGEVWESVGDIEDEVSMRETLAMSYGVRELCFIERECEQLVQSFTRQMRRKSVERYCIVIVYAYEFELERKMI